MQLVDVSHTTLVQWHNKRVKRQDSAVLMQGLDLPSRLSVAADPLPSAKTRPVSAPTQSGPAHHYHLPSSTVGQAQVKKKATHTYTPAVATPVAVRPRSQRQLFPAPPPTSAPQLMLLGAVGAPAGAQGPVLMAAPQALSFSLMPPPAPPAPPPPVRKLTRRVLHNTCKKCGQFRTAETGHSQYKGTVYCPSVETATKEQWLEDMRNK